MTPGGVLKGQAAMSEHAAGVELLREQAQVLACTGVRSWGAKVPTSECTSKARELKCSTRRVSATTPGDRQYCSPWSVYVLFHCFLKLCFSAGVRKGQGDGTGGFCPFAHAPDQWWCCAVVPRKHGTEPKMQLSWCPVALARTAIACRWTPKVHSTENSWNFPFLNKMIYSSLSYGKETMGKGDEVCQEQCIPFISVFSLTHEKCRIITERSKQVLHNLEIKSKYFWQNIFSHQKEQKHCFTENRNESMAVILDRLPRLKEQEICQEMPVSNSRGQEPLLSLSQWFEGNIWAQSKYHEMFWHDEDWKHRLLYKGKINYSWRRSCLRPKRHFPWSPSNLETAPAPIWIFLFPLRCECTAHMFAVSHLVAQKWVGEIV